MENIEIFNTELRKVNRPGIEDLIDCMDAGGFYTAPCSTKYHLCKDGGLLEHSLNVLNIARRLNKAWGDLIDDETIIVVSLLHDLGKMGDHGKEYYIPKILKDGSRSVKEPYISNGDLVYIDHEIRSVMIAERYIELSEDEETAILWHNGLYSMFKYQIPGKETALFMILHFSDLWCSRIVEVEDGDLENN